RVKSLVLLLVWPLRVELPAGAWLLGWLGLQILSGLRALDVNGTAARGGVAFWAHVGGFLARLALYRLFLAAPPRPAPLPPARPPPAGGGCRRCPRRPPPRRPGAPQW